MAKRITLGKREREKLKQTKRQDKQKKKEERLSGGSRSFEDMLAYVDENGVLHTTPPVALLNNRRCRRRGEGGVRGVGGV